MISAATGREAPGRDLITAPSDGAMTRTIPTTKRLAAFRLAGAFHS